VVSPAVFSRARVLAPVSGLAGIFFTGANLGSSKWSRLYFSRDANLGGKEWFPIKIFSLSLEFNARTGLCRRSGVTECHSHVDQARQTDVGRRSTGLRQVRAGSVWLRLRRIQAAKGRSGYLNSKPCVLPVERMSEVEKGQSCSTFSKSARSTWIGDPLKRRVRSTLIREDCACLVL
jgi:hypothetical protein